MSGDESGQHEAGDTGNVAADESIGLIWPEERAAFSHADLGLEFVDSAPAHSVAPAASVTDPSTLESSLAEILPRRPSGPLTEQELTQVVGSGSPVGVAAKRRRRNRRGQTRYAVSARAQAIVERTAETVMLRNLSAGGVCLLQSRALKPGDTFRLSLPVPDSAATLDRDCTVLRCKRGGSGLSFFQVAARFAA